MERNYVTATLCILIKRSVTKTAILTADAVVDVDATVRTRDETGTELRFADTLTTATAYLSRLTHPITCRNTQCRHNCVELSVRTVSASQNYTQGEIKGATENARPENAGLENDGQLRKESQGLENAGLENDGPC